jgi:hypothetical protein
MNQSVGRRWVSLRLDPGCLTVHGLTVHDDGDVLDQWDQLALRLHGSAPHSRSSMTTDIDQRHRVRRPRPNRAVGQRSVSAPLRKSVIKADLRRLKRQLEAVVARGCEACVLAIAV